MTVEQRSAQQQSAPAIPPESFSVAQILPEGPRPAEPEFVNSPPHEPSKLLSLPQFPIQIAANVISFISARYMSLQSEGIEGVKPKTGMSLLNKQKALSLKPLAPGELQKQREDGFDILVKLAGIKKEEFEGQYEDIDIREAVSAIRKIIDAKEFDKFKAIVFKPIAMPLNQRRSN